MRPAVLGSLFTAGVLLRAASAIAQPTLVDLRDVKPQQVKSAVFTMPAARAVRLDAVGSESARDTGAWAWVTAMWRGRSDTAEPWMGDAWILDLRSRRVVWQLSTAGTARGSQGTRTFSGTVDLPAGTYEVFYASFPPTTWARDEQAGTRQRFVNWLNNTSFDQFRVTIHGEGQVLSGAEAERARRHLESGAAIALRGDGEHRTAEIGFLLDRPTEVEVYCTGEAREDAEFDAGRIIDTDTRQPVWRLSWRDSAPAGGAVKNRMVRLKKTLPAGRYAALYATDDSHHPSAWNAAPPRDPYAWGLFMRVVAAEAGPAVRTFSYEHVPAGSVIAAITKVGDDEKLSKKFTVSRATDIRVYALGEGSGDRMFDYGWIAEAATGRKVWEMRYEQTESAGGDAKNRLVDRIIRLDKGDYVLHYVSDDSHSYNQWNAYAPRDTAHWGITVLTAR